MDPRVIGGRHPGLRVQRQAQAHGRIAGHEVAALGAQEPRARLPTGCSAAQRQHMPHHLLQSLIEHPPQPFALQRVIELGLQGIDIHRQATLAPKVVPDILMGREHTLLGQCKQYRHMLQKAFGILGCGGNRQRLCLVGKQTCVLPDRLAVTAPETAQ